MRYRKCPCGQTVEARFTVCPTCKSDLSSSPLLFRTTGAPSVTTSGRPLPDNFARLPDSDPQPVPESSVETAPESPAESGTWYYMSDGHMVGPCEMEELQTALAVGVLPADTIVWAPGMTDWQPIGDVVNISEIAPLAAAETEVSFGSEEAIDEPATPAYAMSVGAASAVAEMADENPIAQHAIEKAEAAAAMDTEAYAVIAALGDTGPHPWRRWFARLVDMTAASFVLGIVIGIFAPNSTIFNSNIGSTILMLLVWAAAEPFVLVHFENTPGKALLNMHLRTQEGRSLTLEQAVHRSLRVWFFGLAGGLPLISLFTMAAARKKLVQEGSTSWDREGGIVVAHGEIGPGRVAGIAVFLCFYFLVSVVGSFL